MNRWRYPDKPMTSTLKYIRALPPGWIIQPKFDGWRCILEWDGTDTIKCHTSSGKTLPFPHKERWRLMLRNHPAMVLDGELMQANGAYWVFDIWEWAGGWVGHQPLDERKTYLSQGVVGCCHPDPISHCRVAYVYSEDTYRLTEKINTWKKSAPIEGVVAKSLGSTLLCSPKGNAINTGWLKAKWR